MSKTYKACIYTRLSRDDGDKAESDSIVNQRALIKDFLKKHPQIEIVSEKSDDGYSGVNFERPGFQKMMDEIRLGKVNCVVVKDLSRFGRNYIESGNYIEKVFPFMGVRFIAVNDNYDSKDKSQADSLVIPFKNLINDAYCKDISVKIRSQLEIKRKKGEFIGAFAVYGYMKHPENKNQLIPDPFASEVVRSIFKWKEEGMSQISIADRLNAQGVLCPMEYKLSQGMKVQTNFRVNKKAVWSPVSVTRILKNEIYTGVLIQGKTTTPNYKVKKLVDKAESEWIRVEGSHEAIVEKELFKTVQELLKKDTRISPKEELVFPLAGYVKCGDCRQSMVCKTVPSGKNRYKYFVCSTHKAKKGCSTHSISEKKLMDSVLYAVNQQIQQVSGMENLLCMAENLPEQQKPVMNLDVQIVKLKEEIERNRNFKLKLYESLQDGMITQDEYFLFKKNYEDKIKNAEDAVQTLEADRNRAKRDYVEDTHWMEIFKRHQSIETLTRKAVIELIDTVYVYEDNRINVVFKYAEEREKLWELVQQIGA